MILGLPEVTVFTVGGVTFIILVLLTIWALKFPKVED